ncbi:TVP38/TMEM64 family protein [bacterium]|nr:MAG: TVP38/TMEM64 family protein [bacterium]
MTKRTRHIFLALWVLGACAGFYAWWQSDIPVTQLPAALKDLIEEAGVWGPVVYILLFIARALTLAPATPFVLAAGLAWGPWLGMFWAWVGINLSGMAAYGVAKAMGREWVAEHETPWMAKLEAKLLARPFMTSLLLRLLLLPFDTVNYACGLVDIPFLPYVAGTALGVLPGVVTFALFGGAWNDPRAIAVSGAVFGASLAGAALLKKRGLVG